MIELDIHSLNDTNIQQAVFGLHEKYMGNLIENQ